MTRTTSFVLKGVPQLKAELGKLDRLFEDRGLAALRQEGEAIMTQAKRDFVPVDAGTLRSSGHVTTERSGKDVEVHLNFGGAAAPYALAVHEHPSEHSPPSWEGKSIDEINWSPNGRGPKYLEKPFNEAADGMLDRIAQKVRP